eukprot:CAMPEP_0197541124 /NCGR_PEP_ID=MMETSP1318-20131121/66986_1 /TAXON_ID=552666 /ORGANISM="Partenskyella glossopodia, Strain RCC365" /LENGTH=332 /DNA_ID=CAMNT_0043100265 /DNA_START=136 /DNA_END=1134 /DNA_ORIENTATION=-
MTRMARTHYAPTQLAYSVPVLVCFQEVLKLVGSVLFLWNANGRSAVKTTKAIKSEVLLKPSMTLRLSVPAILYFIQNVCIQAANSYLPAAVYQLTYQGKTLVVALMSVILLDRRLELYKWLAIGGLGIGVGLVQVSNSPDAWSKLTGEGTEGLLVGLMLTVCAAFCSGCAGVYFEKMVKTAEPQSSNGTQQPPKQKPGSLWIRNIQLAIFSIVIGIGATICSPSFDSAEPFKGFDSVVWALGVDNAFGGLVVAVVIKYADNIMKCFSNATSTLIATILCIPLFDFEPSSLFLVGAVVIICSVLLHGRAIRLPHPIFDKVLCLVARSGNSSKV